MNAGRRLHSAVYSGHMDKTEHGIWRLILLAYSIQPGITRLDSLEWELLQSVEEVIAPFSESVTSLLANTLKDKLP